MVEGTDYNMQLFDILKVIVKISFIIPVFWGLVSLVTSAMLMVYVSIDSGVLNDIFALVQLWLPFDLNVVLVWIGLSVTGYMSYAISVMMLNILNTWLTTK